jgi:hypothetical protein
MAFMFLVFFGIALILCYMMRVSGQRHEILRGELLKMQDALRTLEALLSARAKDRPDRVNESPLAMPETGALRKTGVFDPELDLHFDSAADKH